ncbi:protein timeless homolog isoform X2 [Bacillus rossius redtenbacheri]|uniref:protein timeless homolog isoform X2 n=1 Tax=Bacillus rossius redtenbacheri TaxID=93214 RepID=UPI002FDF0A37
MSSLLYAELAATCNALGYYDGNKYYVDAHCVETVKDLIRYLRRDDANHEIRRHLGEAKVLQTDLLPILKDHWRREDLFDVVLRLLVNLTNPVLLLYREELPEDKASRNYYLQLIGHLQAYKEAFADGAVWGVFNRRLGEIMQIVPADPAAERRTDNDASIHDQVLWALHESGMVDLLLYVSSMEHEHQYYMHILEIVSLMMREQSPAELAGAALQRSEAEKQRDETQLLAVRRRETEDRLAKVKKYAGSRHSRFGGTFVLKDVKSISDQDLIYHKPLNKLESLNFDLEKSRQKRPRNRLPMKDDKAERRSAYSIRLFLKEFCVEFLTGAYNSLMHTVKDGLARARTQANDESYYLWAMKFFMEFNRHYNFQVQYVSETMHVQTFHFVQTQLENCYEMMVTDKKKLRLWSKRMHLALQAYQELLMTLTAMDKSPDESVRNSSKVIKNNVFYVIEYRELILTLLLNFDEVKMSRLYLKDLIETAHIFFKMLEQFCSRGHVMVQKPVARRKKRRKQQKAVATEPQPSAEDAWNDLAPEISAVLQGGALNTEAVPFDAVTDRDMDDQKVDVMRNIQKCLKERKFEEAIATLRACREIWPEEDLFGSHDVAPEEELLLLKDIFITVPGSENEVPATVENPEPEDNDDDESDDDDEEEEGMGTRLVEQDFKFMDFARRLAHSKVMSACCLLLAQFDRNSAHTNHCAAKMLHRVAFDCKMPAMLFQASLFRTFQRVFESRHPQHKELAKFAGFVLQKFAQVAEKNKKVFMELLFWKSSRDAFEIENGYGSYSTQTHSSKMAWTEEEEFELQRLYDEYMGRQEGSSAGMVDWIMENLINKDRSKRGVTKKLKEMGIVVNSKAPSKRPPKQWQSCEEEQLAQLFGQFRESADPVGEVAGALAVQRPRSQVVAKLLGLGLARDRKELRKKRSGKSRHALDAGSEDDSAGSDSSDSGGSSGPAGATQRGQKHTAVARRARWRKAAPREPGGVRERPAPAVQFSREKASAALQNVIAAGMQEAAAWLRETLLEEAADRGGGRPLEGVPVLPLSEPCVAAMDDPGFLRAVAALGLEQPLSTEGVYWRMPASMTAQDLRVRANVISIALGVEVEGTEDCEGSAAAEAEPVRNRLDSESSGDEFEHLRKFLLPAASRADDGGPPDGVAERAGKQTGIGEEDDEAEGTRGENPGTSADVETFARGGRATSRKRVFADSSSEGESGERAAGPGGKSRQHRKIVVQSSDSEPEAAVSPPPRDEDEDVSRKVTKRFLDSDSDDDGAVRSSAKRQPIIEDEND